MSHQGLRLLQVRTGLSDARSEGAAEIARALGVSLPRVKDLAYRVRVKLGVATTLRALIVTGRLVRP